MSHTSLRLFGLLLLCLASLLVPAEDAAACQKCHGVTVFMPMYSCVPVEQYETGATECYTFPLMGGTACRTRGDFCSVVDAGSGGGSGGQQTGGGGGNSCVYDNGYCAPWCAACNQTGP